MKKATPKQTKKRKKKEKSRSGNLLLTLHYLERERARFVSGLEKKEIRKAQNIKP